MYLAAIPTDCPGGATCLGEKITGTHGQVVCGKNQHHWQCTGSGWTDLGTACAASECVAAATDVTDAQIIAEFHAWTGRDPTAAELAAIKAKHEKTISDLDTWVHATYAAPSPTPTPTPTPTPSPPPLMLCQPPTAPALDATERWYLTDPVQCLWEIIRDGVPLPETYKASPQLIIPQSAASSITAYLPPLTSGVDTTGITGVGTPVTDSQILVAFQTIAGRYPTTTELATIRGQGYTSIADLDAAVQSLLGVTVTSTGSLTDWLSQHWLLAAGVAVVAVVLMKKK